MILDKHHLPSYTHIYECFSEWVHDRFRFGHFMTTLQDVDHDVEKEESSMQQDLLLSAGKYLSEGASIANGSTVVDISIPPPFFKLISLSLSCSPLSKTPKYVIF